MKMICCYLHPRSLLVRHFWWYVVHMLDLMILLVRSEQSQGRYSTRVRLGNELSFVFVDEFRCLGRVMTADCRDDKYCILKNNSGGKIHLHPENFLHLPGSSYSASAHYSARSLQCTVPSSYVHCTQFVRALYFVRTCTVLSSYVHCTQFVRALYSVRTCTVLSSYAHCAQFVRALYSVRTCIVTSSYVHCTQFVRALCSVRMRTVPSSYVHCTQFVRALYTSQRCMHVMTYAFSKLASFFNSR